MILGIFFSTSPRKESTEPRTLTINPDGTHSGGAQLPTEASMKAGLTAGPRTFGGENLSDRTIKLPDGKSYAIDGSHSIYVHSMANKAWFEYRTSSPQGILVDAWLSMWTTRTWTVTGQAAATLVDSFCHWLSLDFLGRKLFAGSKVPWWGRSGNAVASFRNGSQGGAQAPGHE